MVNMGGIENTVNEFKSVSDLTEKIKNNLETSFPTVTVTGEIADYKLNTSGHLYFTLKDEKAQLHAAMFKRDASSLDFTPKNGMQVKVTGRISFYDAQGKCQIIVRSMTEDGIGKILEEIERRRKKFDAEGLFWKSKEKRPLPLFPKTIGVVTSPNAAALRDILNIRRRRNDKVNIVILPSSVQGEKAAGEIAHMIKIANHYKICDVLIVGRGGGSPEDLLPFSEEIVVRAICDSEIPVVSSVGHEIDHALSDDAADLRAPTPSAAAEITIPLKTDIERRINMGKQNLYEGITSKIDTHRKNMRIFDPENMEMRFQNIKQSKTDRFDRAFDSLTTSMEEHIKEKKRAIEKCIQDLENGNPQTVFERGYSMVCDAEGKIIRNAKDIMLGEKIKIRPAEGLICATVDSVS